MERSKKYIFLIIIFSLLVRIFLIDKIPAEMWGDVNEHFQYAREILNGNLRYKFWGGDGPIFDYLVAIFFKIFGYSFEIIKLTTAFLGVLIIYLSYVISKKLSNKKLIYYLTPFLMSFSFWLISFSRQAKPYILVLLFVELFLYFFLNKKYFLSGIILGVGLFAQSSFWGMMFLIFFNWKIFLSALPFVIFLFFNEIKPEILNNNLSYLGEKTGKYLSFNTKIINFFSNVFDNFQSYFFRGDVVFRHNIPYQPVLDIFSSIIFFIGFIIFIKEFIKNKKIRFNYIVIFLVFIFSQLASFLDIANPQNSPSFGRMIGSAFFIYFILAKGLVFLYEKIKSKNLLLSKLFLIIYLNFYAIFNFYNYFFIYPQTLPNKNIPFGRLIVEDIIKNYNKSNSKIFLFTCCWGEWGQPEPKSIENYLISKKYSYFNNYIFIYDYEELINLIDINKSKKIIIYTNPFITNFNYSFFQNKKINLQIQKLIFNDQLVSNKIILTN